MQFSVEYKTLIIVAEWLQFLPQLDHGLSFIKKWVKNIDWRKKSKAAPRLTFFAHQRISPISDNFFFEKYISLQS